MEDSTDIAKKGCGVILLAVIIFFGFFGFIAIAALFGGEEKKASSGETVCTSAKIPSGALKNINKNIAVYKQAAEEVDIPWEMIAGMHFRETKNSRVTPSHNTGDGVYQILSKDYPYPAGEKLTDEQFLEETIDAAKFLKGKSRPEKFGGEKLKQETTNPDLIKDTFWGYNGRAYGSFDKSPYVMNNFDEEHMHMPIITLDGGEIDGIDIWNGAYTTFVILKGSCSETTGESTGSAGEKDGSVGYFHDFISEKAGIKFGVGSGCLASRDGGKRKHNGYDFAAVVGTPIYAVYSGKVTFVGDWFPGDGRQAKGDSVRIKRDSPDKDGATYYQYTHITPDSSLKVGQKINQGDLIGKIKPLGGPHLDVKKSDNPQVLPNARICNGGTARGLPKDKYKEW